MSRMIFCPYCKRYVPFIQKDYKIYCPECGQEITYAGKGMKNLLIISKRELGRVLLHIPLGLLTCLLGYTAWWLGLTFACGFILYELNQDMHLSDEAFIDIKGWIWGVGIGGLVIFGLKIGGIL